MERIGVGLLGYGTVGSGVGKLLRESAGEIQLATGKDVYLRRVCELPGFSHPDLDAALVTSSFDDIVNDPDIQIVVELIGGIHPALEFQTAALKAGKSVVTANKELLANFGTELFGASDDAGVDLLFEASAVAGGIPLIRPLRESLVGEDVSPGDGHRQRHHQLHPHQDDRGGVELRRGARRGAEPGVRRRRPHRGCGGLRAGAKMAILASIAFHSRVTLADVQYEGITAVTAADIAHARSFGYVIKLLGVAKLIDGRMNVRVYPAFLPEGPPAGRRQGRLQRRVPGERLVRQDHALRSRRRQRAHRLGRGRRHHQHRQHGARRLRAQLHLLQGPGLLSRASGWWRVSICGFRWKTDQACWERSRPMFGEEDVSIRSVVQTGRGDSAELVMVLHPAPEAAVMKALARVGELAEVQGSPSFIRVEGEDGV